LLAVHTYIHRIYVVYTHTHMCFYSPSWRIMES